MKTFPYLLLLGGALISASCATNAGSAGTADAGAQTYAQLAGPKAGDTIAVIRTSMGDITVLLFPQYAPKTVENFTTHARNGYYDGVIFHRVINEFMIQGGDPTGTGSGGESIWGDPFEDEVGVGMHHIRGALSMANSGPNTNGSQFFIVQRTNIEAAYATAFDILQEFNAAIADPLYTTRLYFNWDEGAYLLDDENAEEYVLRERIPLDFLEYYVANGGTPHLDFPGINRGVKHSVFGQVIDGMDVVDAIAAVEVVEPNRPAEEITIITVEIRLQ